jgi:hypothetical protein
MDIPKTDVGGQIAGGKDPARKERQGLPEATSRGNRMNPLTCGVKQPRQTRETDGKTTDPSDWRSQESIVYFRRMPILGP